MYIWGGCAFLLFVSGWCCPDVICICSGVTSPKEESGRQVVFSYVGRARQRSGDALKGFQKVPETFLTSPEELTQKSLALIVCLG